MDKEQEKKIEKIRKRIENNSKEFEEIVNAIIEPYTKDLDDYVAFIKSIITDYSKPPTNQELDDFIMTLPVFIYSACGLQEQLGIRDDIAKAVYKEIYNSARDSIEKGTVSDKDSLAELASQEEAITSMLYKRAYGIVKVKVAAAQELLSSLKKVVSRRITEMELTRIGG